MTYMNKQNPGMIALRIASAATDADQEVSIATPATNTIRITAVKFVPDDNLVTDDEEGYVMSLVNKTDTVTLAICTATTADGTATAFAAIDIPVSNGTNSVANGKVLTWVRTTIGTASPVANGALSIEYINL